VEVTDIEKNSSLLPHGIHKKVFWYSPLLDKPVAIFTAPYFLHYSQVGPNKLER